MKLPLFLSAILACCVTACILLNPRAVIPGGTRVAAAQSSGSHYFPETGHSVQGRFLIYWQEHYGLAQQGYPISEELPERSDIDGKTYTVQYFERAVFEYHPEKQAPYSVLLTLLGVLQYRERHPQGAPQQVPNTGTGSLLFHETGKRVGGKFLQYWQSHGGLAQQGYPISEEFTELSPLNGKSYTVQYFERAVFEMHPENAGTQYEVLLSQLGRLRLDKANKSNATAVATPVTITATATATVAATGTPTVSSTSSPTTSTPAAMPTATVPAEATNWLREHAIRLRTVEPDGANYADLLPLRNIVGDARIVAMGEASHGAHEFFSMKVRTFQFLVQQMGFTVFTIEDGYGEAEVINNYVQQGQGSADEAIRGLYAFPWQSQEVLDLIKWMRQYNENRGDAPAISFQGFDIQGPAIPISNVVAYLQRVDAPAAERARTGYSCFASPFTYANSSADSKAACHSAVAQVYSELTQKRAGYESLSSAQEYALAEHNARIVVQSEDYYSTSIDAESAAKRDRYMAENAAWLVEEAGPGAKVMLWAHSAHVATVPYNGVMSMGQYLRQQYGTTMRVFGFDFYQGSFNAISVVGNHLGSLTTHTVQASQEGSYASYFHSAGVPFMALDLRGIDPADPASNWLIGPRAIWGIGAAFDDADPYSATGKVSLTQAFDAVIYVDAITPSRLLQR
ncbi:MAG: erythromycin esterase family protein [Chloroflexota bacterium]|nr:erythromycin esterase family protein [Chloroflexota bacterium]